MVVAIAFGAIASSPIGAHAKPLAQIEELYELQAAFHRAGTVKDPVSGDSADVITQRIKDMLALWSEDAVWDFEAGTPRDGVYIGRGDPDDAAACHTFGRSDQSRHHLHIFQVRFRIVSTGEQVRVAGAIVSNDVHRKGPQRNGVVSMPLF
jgi:hypothetical protein